MSSHDLESCVASVPIFNHLEEEQMKEIMQLVKHSDYKKRIYLYGWRSI